MPETFEKVLVLYAHPAPIRSEVNRPLARASERMNDVTLVDLYAQYPDLEIDVEWEQTQLRHHDVIVFMHPLYWYSTPPILKQWQDLVLEYGFAYGEGGDALQGKLMFSAVTTGGPSEAYSDEGYNNFTLRQMLTPIEQTARLCGMTYLPPFALHSARRAVEEGRVGIHVANWRRLISAIQAGTLDIEAAQKAEYLSDALNQSGKG